MVNALAQMLAKKKESKDAAGLDQPAQSASAPAGESHDVSGTPGVQAPAASPAPATVRPANPFGSRKPSGTDTGAAGESAARTATPTTGGDAAANKPRLAGLRLGGSGAASQPVDRDASVPSSGAGLSLESLSESVDEGIAPVAKTLSGFFADETPADKPTRELPEGLTKDALGFVDLIDSIYGIVHEPDLLGGVIKNIIIELGNNAEYAKLLQPEDVRLMIRGMRESMGLAKIKKQETKTKRAGGSGAKSKLVDADMLADLASLGIDIPE